MGKFIKRPVEVEVLTWDEFLEYGRNHAENLNNGIPWSFEYNGYSITHESDEEYLIPTLEGIMSMTPNDVLITGIKGEVYPCKVDIFKETYESSEEKSSKNEEDEYMSNSLKEVGVVYPSDEITIHVCEDEDYGGAHEYIFNESMGHIDGKAVYIDNIQKIRFVKKEESGMVAGLQSEQLLIALIDRHKKLNNKFPSREGSLAITKMEEALHWLEARVKERIQRGVMGELKK